MKFKTLFFVNALFIMHLSCFAIVPSQTDPAYLIRQMLTSRENRDFKKSTKDIQKANKLMDEVKEMEKQLTSIKDSPGFDENKRLQNQFQKLQNRLERNQLKSLEFYESSIKTKQEIYSRILLDFHNTYSGKSSAILRGVLLEERSNELLAQARELKALAKPERNSERRINILSSAYILEMESLYLRENAMTIFFGWRPVNENDDYFRYQKQDEPVTIVIDEEQLQLMKNYFNKNDQTYINHFREVMLNMQSFDIENIRNIWYAYLHKDLEDILYAGTDENDEPGFDFPDKTETVLREQNASMIMATVNNESMHAETVGIKKTEAKDHEIYRLQLASDRSPLSQGALNDIYSAKKEVELIKDDEIYKYSIGNFSSFEEADKFRSQSGMQNAFVVAYHNMSGQAVQQENKIAAIGNDNDLDDFSLYYTIQIAASRIPLKLAEISNIYKPVESVSESFEDGWYKYAIGKVNSYQEANKIKNNCGVSDAFVAAYKNGKRISLYAAINESTGIKKSPSGKILPGSVDDNCIVYFVQIAANKTPLLSYNVLRLAPHAEKIYMFNEDGWYRYRVHAGSSYAMANSIKLNSNIPGAFIVVYKNGRKVNLKNALELAER